MAHLIWDLISSSSSTIRSFGFIIISRSYRQKHAESCALSNFTLDFDPAGVGFDDHFALIHANANAFFLGGLEGAKQRLAEKFGADAAAIVGDLQDSPAV